jgi:MtN3 and saliva related transmembrane protein
MNFQLIGLIAGVLTTSSFIPQLYRGFKRKHLDDFSGIMIIMLGTGMLLWLIYGISLGELPIILANGISLASMIALGIMKIYYANKHNKKSKQ